MGQPTMEDVARAAGVSRALVSLVMRDSPKVSDARRQAVLRAADELGYRPNVLARKLASRATLTLGVTVNDLHNPFFAEAVDGIQQAAEDAGYDLLFATGGRTLHGESGAIEHFLRLRVDGLVLTGPRIDADEIEAAAKVCPIVLLGRTIGSDAVDEVNNDERVGARLAVEHLIDLGHEHIAHIDGGSGAGAEGRRRGYETVMRDHGLDARVQIVPGDFTEASGAHGARALAGRGTPPTAIFAANDLAAAGALAALADLGLRVPDEVSLVGYDNSAIASLHHLSLTTIDQPRAEMGRIAVEVLLERVRCGRAHAVHHVVTPSLVVRDSTAPPRARPEDER